MKQLLVIVATVICFISTCPAQEGQRFEKPNYAKIEQITKDKKLKSYYPNLFRRYEANDTTLTVDDFYLLYYGNFFQEKSSKPSGHNYTDSIRALYQKDVLSKNDKLNFVRYTKEELKSDPFSIRNIGRLHKLYRELGDTANSMLYLFKLQMIARTVFTTGDGKTDTTGIHVLSVGDEYSIVSLLGYESDGGQTLTANQCDYLTLKPNSDDLKGIYFDVNQIFAGYAKMFEGVDLGGKKKKKK